jgi:hypothetical protein
MSLDTLATYGPWGVGIAAVLAVVRLLIAKGYGVKIDIGPRRSRRSRR